MNDKTACGPFLFGNPHAVFYCLNISIGFHGFTVPYPPDAVLEEGEVYNARAGNGSTWVAFSKWKLG
ncbi:hypothetical protein CF651_00230 [Paenibacillus rigui]|uniref:Uncharacterized protein n=1 Tax=Paenibacillus rigui TaxID=554312 RepID=A0A229UZD5_9BACL|nr:hypothetical protein CF651_00230 [Paenibacillus rigui]